MNDHSSINRNSLIVEDNQRSINRWMGEQNVVCAYMEYHSAIKWNEELMHAFYNMQNFANVMLSDRNHTQKATNIMTSFIWNIQNSQIYQDGK